MNANGERRLPFLYLRHALLHPAVVLPALCFLVTALVCGWVFALPVALFTYALAGKTVASWPRFQKYADSEEHKRLRARRKQRRQRQTCTIAPEHAEKLESLDLLVDELSREHPLEVARFEIEDLLDAYLHLAMLDARYGQVLRRDLKALGAEEGKSKGLELIRARRVAQREERDFDRGVVLQHMAQIQEFIEFVNDETQVPRYGGDAAVHVQELFGDFLEYDRLLDSAQSAPAIPAAAQEREYSGHQ
jgi:hypothetical protein